MIVSAWAAPVANDLAVPEKVFPNLDVILKGAVQQSPRMLSRALDLEVAENNRVIARANLLPTFGGSYSYYQASDDRADLNGRTNVTKIAYNASIVQPLYHWGERRNLAKIGEIQQKVTQGQYREGYRLLAQELRTNYLHLILLKLTVKRATFFLDFSKVQLAQAEDRLTKKVISETEIFSVRLAAEQAQIALERAIFDYENAKVSFTRLAGMGAALTEDYIPDSIPPQAYAAEIFDQQLAGFLAQKNLPAPEAVNLRDQLEIEKLNYLNVKTRLRPKINAVIGTSQDEQSYSLNVAQKYQVNSIYAGVSVSWNIFDGFTTDSLIKNSLAKRRQMETDYEQLTQRLGQDAQTQIKMLNFAARNMAIYDRLLNSGEGNLRTKQDEFKRGVRSDADVSQAQIGLYDAQINTVLSRTDYLLKTAEFLGLIVEDPVLANVTQK